MLYRYIYWCRIFLKLHGHFGNFEKNLERNHCRIFFINATSGIILRHFEIVRRATNDFLSSNIFLFGFIYFDEITHDTFFILCFLILSAWAKILLHSFESLRPYIIVTFFMGIEVGFLSKLLAT